MSRNGESFSFLRQLRTAICQRLLLLLLLLLLLEGSCLLCRLQVWQQQLLLLLLVLHMELLQCQDCRGRQHI